MPNSEKFYITTTLPYVNAPPHLGFALELVEADAIARYQRLLGKEVIFNTGTDEHGLKIYQKAFENHKEPQAYVDEYVEVFTKLAKDLNVTTTHFVRTTDPHHKEAAQEFWRRCAAKGDIEKKFYKTKYCVGCELEKTDSELVDGRCPLHPTLEIEIREEENYFFKWSKYQDALLDFYEQHSDFVVPETRYYEIKEFVKRGLQDFSISRLKSKMPWGVPVPGDEEHVMYVWFDALVNYISTLGWPNKSEEFDAFWPGVQIAGKDNLRQQAAMWQAMLMSANVQNSEQVLIHGFITSNGQKMSKSLGNVVGPYEIVEKYGVDALRYWLLREANMFEDSDFTWEKFKESYNANLANGLGNLVSRVIKMAVVNNVRVDIGEEKIKLDGDVDAAEFHQLMSDFDLKGAINLVWKRVRGGDAFVQEREPFKKIKTNPEEAKNDISELLRLLCFVGYRLEPFMPETSEKILEAIKNNSEITTPLFPRI